jgi:hypothetical protein
MSATIHFDCLPFRRVSHAGMPLDAPDEQIALWKRFRAAMSKHGTENTYFLYNADCTFHLTNGPGGRLRFLYEGTVRTDEADAQPVEADLACRLADNDLALPLSDAVLAFFQSVVRRAVMDEFQLFIDAGNLKRTLAEEQQMLREWDKNRGFVGMYI